MEEKHINKSIADGLLKLANELDPNSNSELEIESRKEIEQNGGVQKVLHVMNLCKPFILKVLSIMTSTNNIINFDTARLIAFRYDT